MVNRFGPLEVQGIISRQQVKKSSQSFSPGQSADGTYISDYSYVKDRYFFIDDQFKQEVYPLTEELQHTYNPEYVVYSFDVFKRVTNIESGIIPGTAYLDPFDENSYKIVTGVLIIKPPPPQSDNNKSRRENSGDFERIIRTEKKIGFWKNDNNKSPPQAKNF